jgi:hypothetical protein
MNRINPNPAAQLFSNCFQIYPKWDLWLFPDDDPYARSFLDDGAVMGGLRGEGMPVIQLNYATESDGFFDDLFIGAPDCLRDPELSRTVHCIKMVLDIDCGVWLFGWGEPHSYLEKSWGDLQRQRALLVDALLPLGWRAEELPIGTFLTLPFTRRDELEVPEGIDPDTLVFADDFPNLRETLMSIPTCEQHEPDPGLVADLVSDLLRLGPVLDLAAMQDEPITLPASLLDQPPTDFDELYGPIEDEVAA